MWDLVELPKDQNLVGSKWVFKVITGADGSIEHYKDRLVAQGISQHFGTDYDETFCPVVRQESLHTLGAVSVQNDCSYIRLLSLLHSSMENLRRKYS